MASSKRWRTDFENSTPRVRKKHRDELNPLRDVLIAETALKNDLVFVSEDRNLRTVVEEFGGVAMDIATMLASRG